MNFQIVDTTLREGLQFHTARFSSEQFKKLAKMLDEFGVEYIETINPLISNQKFSDIQDIASMGLKAKVVPHVRCHKLDIATALKTGVKALNILFFGTSKQLQTSSHGKNMDEILEEGVDIMKWAISNNPDVEFRITAEDTFRTDIEDTMNIIELMVDLGVSRIGMADSSGFADPFSVYEIVTKIRQRFDIDLECHFHNDLSCSVANAYAFVCAGGTHVNTCVLGIGERNGITDLAGFIARIYVSDRKSIAKYNLKKLIELNAYVSEIIGEKIPFSQGLNPFNAFSHKAGIHTKAVLNNPDSYEVINPDDFGLSREVVFYSAVTGKHAIAQRAKHLDVNLSEKQLVELTQKIKDICSEKSLTLEEGDEILKKC